jgi:hypothetical protein
MGPLLFLIYINELPKIVNKKAIPILFADDTSILVKGYNSKDFQINMINAFNCVYEWFRINLLSLNINKTHCMQFIMKNKLTNNINIFCNNNVITTRPNIKFLGIHINDSVNWSCHIESLIPKLSLACYIMRSIKSYMPLDTLKIIYYSYFNMVMSYVLYFGGNSCHSLKMFRL